jgi:HrpA-like RNA helicase
LKYLNVVNDVFKFHWLEAPSDQLLRDAVVNLTWLDALDSRTEMLTDVGRTMAKLSLDPMLSAMILAGKRYNCLSHVLALAGMLNVVQNVWWRGKDDQSKQVGNETRASFAHDSGIGGDHISLLRVFLEWDALGENKTTNRTWCRERMINGKSMKMAADFVREVAYQLDPKFKIKLTELNDDLIARIMHCVCAGFFQHLAISNGCLRAGYQLVNGSTGTFAQVHRSSTLTFAQQAPKFIIYHDILILNETNYLTAVCPIDLDWLDKRWLDSLPRAPSQCALTNVSFTNLGPALLLSIVGKKCRNKPLLQESLGVFIDADYQQSQLTVWGPSEKLQNAQMHFKRIIKREREKLRTEVQEFEIIGTTRILLGAGAQVQLVMVEDEYVKVLLNSLPINVTEEEIQAKCCQCGTGKNLRKDLIFY